MGFFYELLINFKVKKLPETSIKTRISTKNSSLQIRKFKILTLKILNIK